LSGPESRLYWKLRDKFSLEELKNFSQEHFIWAIENLKLDQKDDFGTRKDFFEALQPWLDREQYNYIREQKEIKEQLRKEDTAEARKMLKSHLDKLGVKLPEGTEVALVEEEEASEVIE